MDDDNMRQMNKMKPLLGCKVRPKVGHLAIRLDKKLRMPDVVLEL